MRAIEIVNKLLNHEITKSEAIDLILERNDLSVGLDYEIIGMSYTVEGNHSNLKLEKRYGHREAEKMFKAGDKVKIIRTN